MINGYGLTLRLQYFLILNNLGMFGAHLSWEGIGLESVSSALDVQVFLELITGKTFASVEEILAALDCKLSSLVLGTQELN